MNLKIFVTLVSALVLVIFSLSAPALGADKPVDLDLDPDALPREINGFEGTVRGLWRDGRVYIGGQPDEVALSRLHEFGVAAVVNLRTATEMDDRERVPFDEAAAVASLKMEYIHIELGGEEHPYTPAAVELFASVLERHDGIILLHCTVGWRASHLWSAYLATEHGFSLESALARGEAMAISEPPIEGLLGRPLRLVYAD